MQSSCPGFVDHKDDHKSIHRFQHHFCASCTSNGIAVNLDHIRLLPEDAKAHFVHILSRGFWATTHPPEGVRFRVVNQTAKCKGVPLVIFQSAADAEKMSLPSVARAIRLDSFTNAIQGSDST